MRVALAAIVLAALPGCAEPTVTRVVDGRPTEGRYISAAAYALYARGAEAETAGDLAHAIRAFERAAAEDPESPEIWTRLGKLHCRVAPKGSVPPLALSAFARAEALDPDHAPLHRERARCLASRAPSADGQALADADRALALDPDDLDTALVRALVLTRIGRAADALRALRALTARYPSSPEPWRALEELATHSGDSALTREAAEHLARAGVAAEGPTLSTIDRALQAGDLAAARRRARERRLPGAELALRAAALGKEAIAREQGELVLSADPADTSARIALIAAADLRGDVAALSDLMRALPPRPAPPSPLGRWLLAEVLRRRVGAEAALAWLGNAGGATDGDPLLAATEKRVREALQEPTAPRP